ncbi:hypothetical protein [Salinibacter ruber]|uniref:hypothetical protein n=1 Tax=Salinibacter ruber TaxID=146919 RepID=UPI002168080E|nr:hypothetical protein [Salinibacter ruber]MCS3612532.1 hypothetical protein [Salinibacter ruber]MCS3648358.1 hypothetical protein [Salinibacter ruber]MCS3784692.1 hypothetical protein [Salinibacter ruber]MCS4142178.1 hypothetical protein [Salinibacter ruber]
MSSAEEKNESENHSGQGPKEVRVAYFRSQDKKELRRVLKSRDEYKSPSRLLWDHLDRSLLPRIRRGEYRPRKLAAAVARWEAGSSAREHAQLALPDWTAVEEAARVANRDLRRLDETLAWHGSTRGVPFCLLEATAIVRAAAREVATSTRGGPLALFSGQGSSKKTASGWKSSNRNPFGWDTSSWDASSRDASEQDDSQKDNSREDDSNKDDPGDMGGAPPEDDGPSYQVLAKLPGRERAGKPVMLPITVEAKDRLIEKARGRAWDGSDLARGALRKLLSWIQEAPGEASEYVRAGSPLYQPCREGSYSGYQLYIEPETKRELEQTRAFLEKYLRSQAGGGFDRRLNQREILQAAARLAIETSGPRPPLPGQS